jgi:integrase
MSSIRRKPSGRYEARYRDPQRRSRGKTFATKAEARRYLDRVGAAIADRAYRDPSLAKVTVKDYADWWLANRPELRPRTAELYEGLLRLHIYPVLGPVRFERLTIATVREWHAGLTVAGRPGPVTVAKAYRLLRTICNDAVADGLLVVNPCAIRGAGVERSPERPVVSVAQVEALADAIEPRYRAMVLLATYCGLRLGELLALRRHRLGLLHRTVRVEEQRQELSKGGPLVGPPKTAAGVRTVAIPPHIIADLEQHLATWTGPEPEALLFTGPLSAGLRRATFYGEWKRARAAAGLPHLHFHDLRHAGNVLAAATGASTKELMARMGHASPRAALIYQHATTERDVAIAEGISALASVNPRDAAPVHVLNAPAQTGSS